MNPTARHWHLPLGSTDGRGPQTGVAYVRHALARAPAPALPEGQRADDVLLVTCELLTNAYCHTPGPICLDLDLDHGVLTVAVTDASPRPPVVRPYRPQQPHGHGLHIVERLAVDWGVTPLPSGKTVWAVLPAP
ncbi:ATP-binding protein [Kitasatospora sp. DSM 101779]|uniref:ATP-binding protein n=1 Tax=Kitasatospora sp. DSM 101779 TaxID=2853165 RepID=UPI0021D9C833|nr:ATP-binding protein [Kitasatospora sp. DSM 101779]MCU7826830.1 ATP-binding protein [Kitasatospora sp. DSM 101779]